MIIKILLTAIIKALLITIAAMMKAVADTIAHHGGGVLRRKWGDFFDINVQGWIIPGTKYPFNGWHIANSITIASLILAAVINSTVPWWIMFILLSTVFILVFNLFWNKVLK